MSVRAETLIFEAQAWADSSVVAFGAFERGADGVRIVGVYPKDGPTEKVVEEVVRIADLEAAPVGQNLAREAAQRIERALLPPELRQAAEWYVGPQTGAI